MTDRGGYLESLEEIPEPHAFTAFVQVEGEVDEFVFEEHVYPRVHADLDNNMRAAIIHVIADAAVSVLVIVGLSRQACSAGCGWTRWPASSVRA